MSGVQRKIAVVLIDRANYGRLKPVMQEIAAHPNLHLITVCSGTMVLSRFDLPVEIVRNDGFEVDSEIFIELEGSTPTTMAKSLGFGIMEFASEFNRLKPDAVVVIGDRYEGLAAALAASYMNICLVHIQGGEVSGSIDESARHCISKLAHFHFPATERAAQYLRKMGEAPDTIFLSGCPSGDLVKQLDLSLRPEIFKDGVGAVINHAQPYFLVVFHPVTTAVDRAEEQVETLLNVLNEFGRQVIWMWPNIDAGSDKVSTALRRFREVMKPTWLRFVKNFSPEDYLRVLANASCAIGNSSSFVRDSSFLGTPVVLVGNRQSGREISHNVIPVECQSQQISEKLNFQLNHGPYAPSTLYGNGRSGAFIAEKLAKVEFYIQKQLSYVSFPDEP